MCEILSKEILPDGSVDMNVQFPVPASPGQFIHVKCGDGVLLRRPISICDAGSGWLRFVFAVRGEGTECLARLNPGDAVDILGPLGVGFNPDKKGEGVPVVVGGGIGIFPLLYLSGHTGAKTEAILGFRSADAVVMEEEFSNVCAKTYIATDDGSYGEKGFVTDVLRRRIAEGGVSSIYVCGPTPMMKAVKAVAESTGIYCELSLEERMGCGIGACAVCVCKSEGEYVKVCQNGPVFDSREVDFDA